MTMVRKNPGAVIPVPPEAGGIQVNKNGCKRNNHPSASASIRLHLSLLVLLLGFICVRPVQASEVYILQSSNLEAYGEVIAGFQAIFPEARVASLPGDPAKNDALIEQLRQFEPAAVLAVGAPAAALLREKMRNVPIIYCMISDPGRHDLAGGNVSGVLLKIRPQEQLAAFKKALPAVRRIGVLYNPEVSGEMIAEARPVAKALNLLLIEKTVTRQEEIADALGEMMWGVDALWMIPDPTVVSKESFQYILEASISRRLPLFTFSDVFVRRGALLAVAPDYPAIGRQAGELVQKIMQGQSPAGIAPLYAPGSLVVNRRTAEILNIPLSAEILKTAAKVY